MFSKKNKAEKDFSPIGWEWKTNLTEMSII